MCDEIWRIVIMTAEKAAEIWDCSVSTVYGYCQKGLIRCEKIANNWNIPDNQCRPLDVRKKLFTQEEVEFYILKAINKNRYISYKYFCNSFDKNKFYCLVDNMVSKGLIVKIHTDSNVIPNDYLITDLGKNIIYQRRIKAIKLLAEIFNDFATDLICKGA